MLNMLGETKRMAEQAHNRTSDDHISQVLDSPLNTGSPFNLSFLQLICLFYLMIQPQGTALTDQIQTSIHTGPLLLGSQGLIILRLC